MAAWRYENFSSSVEKYFTSERAANERNIFQHEKFRISKWPCNVLFII